MTNKTVALLPALLAIRIVPALETKGARDFTHLPVPVVAADIRPQRCEDFAVVLSVLFAEFRIGNPTIQKLNGRVPEQREIALRPLHQHQIVLGNRVTIVGRENLLQLGTLLPEVFAIGREDVVATNALDQRLLGRAQRVPHVLIDDHVGD